MKNKKFTGSVLILAVVLTSLLAVVGVMFVMTAQVNSTATSAIAENRELNFAIEAIIADISQKLAEDVPGVAGKEYYDYPGDNDRWLASLEPYEDGGNYYWGQISDVTGYIERDDDVKDDWKIRDIELDSDAIIEDHKKIELDDGNIKDVLGSSEGGGQLADADGDGVADSKWIKLDNINSSKGKPIFAAIRVVDNGGMLNVNTVFADPDPGGENERTGDKLTDIYINGLVKTGDNNPGQFLKNRSGDSSITKDAAQQYHNEVSRRIENPFETDPPYTLYDISDELSLRNRFVVFNEPTITRLESKDCFGNSLRSKNKNLYTPVDDSNAFNSWERHMDPFDGGIDPNKSANLYSFRKLLTTYNMDRIINTAGSTMVNVNAVSDTQALDKLYDRLVTNIIAPATHLTSTEKDQLEAEFAQIAANIKDYSDVDSEVTRVRDADGGFHYGFEGPCIYISELVQRYRPIGPIQDPIPSRSYAIELYKRFASETFNNWRLIIEGPAVPTITILLDDTTFSTRGGRYYVIVFEDPGVSLDDLVDFNDSPAKGATGVDPDVVLQWPKLPIWYFGDSDEDNYSYDVYFGTDSNDVADADNSSPEFIGNFDFDENSYDPSPLNVDTEYYWRIDDVYNSEVISTIGVWRFTTWLTPPNNIWGDLRGPGDPNVFNATSTIRLERPVADAPGGYLVVDSISPPSWLLQRVVQPRSYQRDTSNHRLIKRLWEEETTGKTRAPTLGHSNSYSYPDPTEPIKAWPSRSRNVGEAGMVLRKSTYPEEPDAIGPLSTEAGARSDLADPYIQKLFKHLTVFDPNRDGIDNDGDDQKDAADTSGPELKIHGRININTAPWYVISQLPWVSQKIAQAIVAYRDKLNIDGGPDYSQRYDTIEGSDVKRTISSTDFDPDDIREDPGFATIGELNFVINDSSSDDDYSMRYYALDNEDLLSFPDLTHGAGTRTSGDGVADDFEERDIIFHRISDLVTVRSDVFTAYILVRIGADGPQKRVIAILDRSNVYSPTDKVKIAAVHPVPDPR